MTDFRMRVAGFDVAVRSMHDLIRRQCADYLTDGPFDFDHDAVKSDITIAPTQSDIDRERRMGEPGDWRDDYLESLAVFRAIAEYAPTHDGLVFHGATIEVDGRAYIFTAPSGTGKSTHIALWRRVFGDRVHIINGDKPILRFDRTDAVSRTAPCVIAYGTPWAGKEGWQRNTGAPLAGICVVTRAGASDTVIPTPDHDPTVVAFPDDDGIPNTCVRLGVKESLPLIFRQTYRPEDPAAAVSTLGLLDDLLAAVPVYQLSCTISEAAVRASSTAMLPPGKVIG